MTPAARLRPMPPPLRGLVCALLLAAGLVHGAAVPPVDQPPTWDSLSPQHQAALAPLQRDWATIGSRHKERWIRLATRLPSMPADERQRVQERMTQWARMSAEERSEARLRYQQSRRLSPDERKARWEAYQALSPEARQALVRHAAETADRQRDVAVRDGAKRNLVPPDAPAAALTPVAPAVVRAAPGVTTSPLSRPPPLPDHQQAGLPKINAGEGFVEPNTLLPQRGPQAAAVRGNAPQRPAGRSPGER